MKIVRSFWSYLWNRPIHRLWLDSILIFLVANWTPWVTFWESMFGLTVCVVMSMAYSLSEIALKPPAVVELHGPVTCEAVTAHTMILGGGETTTLRVGPLMARAAAEQPG